MRSQLNDEVASRHAAEESLAALQDRIRVDTQSQANSEGRDIVELRTRLEVSAHEHERSERRCDELSAEMARLHERLEARTADVAAAEIRCQHLHDECVHATERANELESALKDERRKTATADEVLVSDAVQIEDLRTEKADVERQLDALLAGRDELRDELRMTDDDLRQHKADAQRQVIAMTNSL